MCKNIFLFLTLVISINSIGQQISEDSAHLSRFRPGAMWFYTGLRPAKLEKARKYDRVIFDLTYSIFNGDLKVFKNKWNSIGINTSLIREFPISKGNTISFGTGLTHSLFRVETTGHLFAPDSSNTFTTHSEIQTFAPETRFLIGNSFSIPLEFRFRTKAWKHIKFHVGGRVGYQANIYSKVISEDKNGKYVAKDYSFADINRWVYSAHMRFGFRNWAIYGSYNLNTLFSNKASTQLNLLQLGISISLF